MQEKLEKTFFDWIVSIWPDDKILAICLALTGFCLIWALAEKTGFIFNWMPKRKLLAEALQTTITGALSNTKVDVGLEYQNRLQRIGKGQSQVSESINFTQSLLGRLYHKTPLHPEALLKAMSYAVLYSLLFWLLPWLTYGTGKLGEATLLPHIDAFFERLLVLSPLHPILVYLWLRRKWTFTGWKKTVAYIVAVSFAFTFATFISMALAGTASIAFAFAFAFAISIAISISISGTTAFPGIVAGIVAGALSGTLGHVIIDIVAFYFVIKRSVQSTRNRYQAQQISLTMKARLKYASWLLAPNLLALVLITAMPYWWPFVTEFKENRTAANYPSFPILFFLGWLPVLNGVFDFLSVSLTQYFLTRMQQRRWTLLWWGIDVLTALLLVFGLYGLVIVLLFILRWLGWGVDPHAIIQQFLNDPRSSLWLLLLALTNILPTLLHWGLGLAGLWADMLGPKSHHAQTWANSVLNGQALGKVDAGDFADYLLFGQRGFSFVLALCLMCWAVWLFSWLLPHGLQWVLSF